MLNVGFYYEGFLYNALGALLIVLWCKCFMMPTSVSIWCDYCHGNYQKKTCFNFCYLYYYKIDQASNFLLFFKAALNSSIVSQKI